MTKKLNKNVEINQWLKECIDNKHSIESIKEMIVHIGNTSNNKREELLEIRKYIGSLETIETTYYTDLFIWMRIFYQHLDLKI